MTGGVRNRRRLRNPPDSEPARRSRRRHRLRGSAVAAAVGLVLATGLGPAHGADVPTRDTLNRALLEPSDLGREFTAFAPLPDDSNDPTGCPALENLSRSPSAYPAESPPEVELTTDTVYVNEQLVAGDPAAIAAGHATARDALATCTRLTFPGNGEAPPLELILTPVPLGSPQSASVRLDGRHGGLPVNGYLVLEPLGTVELVYLYVQIADPSLERAATYYRTAVDKVHRVVGPTTVPTQHE